LTNRLKFIIVTRWVGSFDIQKRMFRVT
jgi:hypothetical protein